MKYKKAIDRLQTILDEISSEELDIDKLSALVKEASKLVKICKDILRKTESELEESLDGLEE